MIPFKLQFYSHVICLGTKIVVCGFWIHKSFYSHVICLGTKILLSSKFFKSVFYSHVICLGTKIIFCRSFDMRSFYSHVICLGTKISNLIFPTFVCHCPWVYYTIFHAFKKAISGFFSVSSHLSFNINVWFINLQITLSSTVYKYSVCPMCWIIFFKFSCNCSSENLLLHG